MYGGAGSPVEVKDPAVRYSIASTYGTVYGRQLEAMLVKITTSDGVYGWGEAQAPVLPEVTRVIVDELLSPLLLSSERTSPIAVRDFLYSAMRVRGHTGGFYIDALSAVDCALWDIAGKLCGQPVCRLLGGPFLQALPTYVSGLRGRTPEEQLDSFERHLAEGATAVKIFLSSTIEACLQLVDEMRKRAPSIGIFVDALWRLQVTQAIEFAGQLAARGIGWLEAPLSPEDLDGHRRLARRSQVRIALGESYRTGNEVLPFLRARAMEVLQPDIGRSGITEGMHLASLAKEFHTGMAPHISLGLGPQIAAALQSAACWPHLEIVECNPDVYALANRLLKEPLRFTPQSIEVPEGPGLGIDLDEAQLARYEKR
jgi:galactonate dehydratase